MRRLPRRQRRGKQCAARRRRRAPPRRHRAPSTRCQDPRRADGRRRTKQSASGAGRGSPRQWESTAPPADGAAAAADGAMRALRREAKDAAIYLAARLPGLDSRRAAACFSSSSPVGAMFVRCFCLCFFLRELAPGAENQRGGFCTFGVTDINSATPVGVVAPGRRRPGAGPAPPGQRRAHRCINDARGACLLSPQPGRPLRSITYPVDHSP